MHIEIKDTVIDPWALIADYQQQNSMAGKYGATSVFVGTMRDFNESSNVQQMTLEHYPGMTEKHLETIANEAKAQWDILDVLIVHRVGEIKPDDTIVLVATWAAHRAHAYEANRYLMEELKSKAPFWKKEKLEGEVEHWVEKNTSGDV